MDPEAIQVLKGIDDCEVKKIQTVYQHINGPSLRDVLLHEDVKDLPVLVFSIAGKTGTGKSFLLNLMIKHLTSREHHQENEDWHLGTVPNCFTWRNGIESTTRGLWICPKIFRLKDHLDNEVGVMLLDAEGMYDGEATDGEIIAFSGISATISYLQMFNMDKKITANYLEGIVMNLIKGIEELNTQAKEELKDEYKLMIVLRDWGGEETYPFGYDSGKEYIKNERKRGTKEYQQLWEMIHRTFDDIECVLLPDPGRSVTKSQFNQSGDLALLDKEFLYEVKRFVEHLFEPANLILPPSHLTGEDIYNIFTSIDGKVADEELSFLNIFTEHGNFSKVEKWKSSFEEILIYVNKFPELEDAKPEMYNILRKAERSLFGKSRTKYLAELREALEEAFNRKVIDIYSIEYKESFHGSGEIKEQQSKIWPKMKRGLDKYICGNNVTRQNAQLIFIKKSATHYYHLLHEYHKKQFKNKCSMKKTLKELAGMEEEEIKSFKECEDFTKCMNNQEVVYALWLKEYQCLKNEMINILLQRIKDITGISLDILEKLRRKQYEHFESFTLLNKDGFNLECINLSNKLVIAKKVGYGMFGPPRHLSISTLTSSLTSSVNVPSVLSAYILTSANKISDFFKVSETERNEDETQITGYSEDQNTKIWPVVNKIISLITTEMVEFSCVFIVYYQDNGIVNVPMFRVNTTSGMIYIDSNCRQYTEWTDFLISNTIPDVVYCYPLNGRYIKTEGFTTAFAHSPASKTTKRILKKGDTVGKVVQATAGIAGCALLFGVTAPIVGVVAIGGGICGGAYGVVRGVQKIVDKRGHGEAIKKKMYGMLQQML